MCHNVVFWDLVVEAIIIVGQCGDLLRFILRRPALSNLVIDGIMSPCCKVGVDTDT